MSSRNFSRVQALTKEVKVMFAQFTIGAAGAPTLVDALGVSSSACCRRLYCNPQ